MNDLDFAYRLYFEYDNYFESTLPNRRTKHSDILSLINRLHNSNIFSVNEIGKSVLGKEIFLITAGKGKTKIFLWSQMHGDESTATRALFDIFNFFLSSDNMSDFKNKLLEQTTIYFMPMVNPDGAEIFQRGNFFNFDINRDFEKLQTPEAKILKATFDLIKADFGFNLHDQSRLYSAGHNFKQATISLLAPPFNIENSLDDIRVKSMMLSGKIFSIISSFIPGHIARYSDEYEPRAFGDNFQKLGTSTILIESGGWKNDPEKLFVRKMNFITLLSAFKSIQEGNYLNESLDTYNSIPLNQKDLFDLVIRNLKINNNGFEYLIDIGINREEINCNSEKGFYVKSNIEDIGDLSVFFGYEDFDFSGMEINVGKTYPVLFKSISEIENLDFPSLYSQGYTNVILKDKNFIEKYSPLPINIIIDQNIIHNEIKTGISANLIIVKDRLVKYIILNGFLIEPQFTDNNIINGTVI